MVRNVQYYVTILSAVMLTITALQRKFMPGV